MFWGSYHSRDKEEKSTSLIIECSTNIIIDCLVEAKTEIKIVVCIETSRISFISLLWKGFRAARVIVFNQQRVIDILWEYS